MNRFRHAFAVTAVLAALFLTLPACERTEPPLALIDIGVSVPDGGGNDPDATEASTGTVFVAPDAPQAVAIAAADVASYLTRMGVRVDVHESTATPACAPGAVTVAFVGDGLAGRAVTIEHPQAYGVFATRCEDGKLLELSGGGLLGRQ